MAIVSSVGIVHILLLFLVTLQLLPSIDSPITSTILSPKPWALPIPKLTSRPTIAPSAIVVSILIPIHIDIVTFFLDSSSILQAFIVMKLVITTVAIKVVLVLVIIIVAIKLPAVSKVTPPPIIHPSSSSTTALATAASPSYPPYNQREHIKQAYKK